MRRLHQLKAFTTMDLGIFKFPYFCKMCGLEKLGPVDQNWLERILSALLLGTLILGRRKQSEGLDAFRFFFKIRVDRGCSRYGVRRFDEPF